MRLLTILLFLSLTTQGQPKTATIELCANGSRGLQSYLLNIDSIAFYKLPENKLAFTVIPREYNDNTIRLKNIPAAKYRLVYKNSFSQRVVKEINVTSKILNDFRLYPDSLLNYPQNTLAKFKDNDTISIKFYTQGCFYDGANKIVIRRKDGKFTASLYKIPLYYTKIKGKDTRLFGKPIHLKTIWLTLSQINEFYRFENEFNFISEDGGCTTSTTYDIESKYLVRHKVDESCDWNGLGSLNQSFFGDPSL